MLRARPRRVCQVVPDNMVVRGPMAEKDRTYYSPEEEVRPV